MERKSVIQSKQVFIFCHILFSNRDTIDLNRAFSFYGVLFDLLKRYMAV